MNRLKCQGRDRVSWLTLRQAVQLAQDLGMFRAPKVLQDWGELSAETQRVRAITAWGTFMVNLYGDGTPPPLPKSVPPGNN